MLGAAAYDPYWGITMFPAYGQSRSVVIRNHWYSPDSMGDISITGLVAGPARRALVVVVLGDVARYVQGVVVGAMVDAVVDVAGDGEIVYSIQQRNV